MLSSRGSPPDVDPKLLGCSTLDGQSVLQSWEWQCGVQGVHLTSVANLQTKEKFYGKGLKEKILGRL